jgi:hypothetical protein
MWSNGAWKYAHCPRCYRQELSTWSPQYYHPPLGTYLKIQAGATPYRCAACRCNFASFRPCREKFVWRHRTHAEPAPVSRPVNQADLAALSQAVNEAAAHPAAERAREFSEPTL